MSNFAYNQTKIAEFLSFYFAIIGVGSSVVASEISAGYDSDGSNENWIKLMWIVTNISTFFLSIHYYNRILIIIYSHFYYCEEGVVPEVVEKQEATH